MTGPRAQKLLHPYPDLPLTMLETGAGRPVFLMHGGAGPTSMLGILDHLAATCRVLLPTRPGWDDTPRPDWFTGVDTLTETYLDLFDDLDLRDVLLIGHSFRGWLASELAVRDRGHRISQIVLMSAIGPEIPGHQVQVPGGGMSPGDSGARSGAEPSADPAAPRLGPPPSVIKTLVAYGGPSLSDPKLLRRLRRVRVSARLRRRLRQSTLRAHPGRWSSPDSRSPRRHARRHRRLPGRVTTLIFRI